MKTQGSIEPERFYEERYASKQEISKFVERVMQAWILKNAIGPKILDSGCGDGTVTSPLAGKYVVTGIDVSEKNLKNARKLGLHAVRHDFGQKKLPFRDEEFDTVISNQVIEHIYDTDFYLEELHRVLKRGGVMLMLTPNAVSLTDRLRVLLGRLPITCEVSMRYKLGSSEPPNGHIRPYTFPELRYQLRRTGFKVIEERTTNFPFPVYWNVPSALKQAAVKMGQILPSLGGQIMMKAIRK